MPVVKPFLPHEDDVLRSMVGTGETMRDMKNVLCRHGDTIRKRAKALGLAWESKKAPLWTEEEDKILFRCERIADASYILGRTIQACLTRMSSLKSGERRSKLRIEAPEVRRERAHLIDGDYRLTIPEIGRITAHYEGPYSGAGNSRHHMFRAVRGGWLVCLSDADCLDPETRLKRCA